MTYLWRDRRFWGSLLISLCLILLMVVTRAPTRLPSPMEWVWLEVLAPVQSLVMEVSERTGGWAGDLLRFRVIVQENVELRGELQQFETLEVYMGVLERENRRLRDLLHLQHRLDVEATTARIIRRVPSNWTRQVTIDRGARHGVGIDDVVVVGTGLVGRVTRVTSNTAQVMLISSPESGLGVEVVTTGDAGVAVGDIAREGMLRATLFDPDATVSEGDIIVTSGLGEAFPAGIPVGTVAELTLGEAGLLREVWIQPVADLNRLHELMVIQVPEDTLLRWTWYTYTGEDDEDVQR